MTQQWEGEREGERKGEWPMGKQKATDDRKQSKQWHISIWLIQDPMSLSTLYRTP